MSMEIPEQEKADYSLYIRELGKIIEADLQKPANEQKYSTFHELCDINRMQLGPILGSLRVAIMVRPVAYSCFKVGHLPHVLAELLEETTRVGKEEAHAAVMRDFEERAKFSARFTDGH